jgi:uncharacterized damage-inducible protein DinB
MDCSLNFAASYLEARTRLQVVIDDIKPEDLQKRVGPSPNSLGFLLRHIGDVELLFAKNVFKEESLHVKAQTLIDGKDNGEWTSLSELINYLSQSSEEILKVISKQKSAAWTINVTTKEFGTKTLAEAFGRIVSHTAYHAGQIALIKKYGV